MNFRQGTWLVGFLGSIVILGLVWKCESLRSTVTRLAEENYRLQEKAEKLEAMEFVLQYGRMSMYDEETGETIGGTLTSDDIDRSSREIKENNDE